MGSLPGMTLERIRRGQVVERCEQPSWDNRWTWGQGVVDLPYVWACFDGPLWRLDAGQLAEDDE